MAVPQYPVGTLLAADGAPFTDTALAAIGDQALPMGGYAATTILVQPDGGRVQLTEHDHRGRFMPYADVYSSQAPIAAVVGKMVRRLAILPRKTYQWPTGNRTTSIPAVGNAGEPGYKAPRTRKAHAEEVCDPSNGIVSLLERPAPRCGPMEFRQWQYQSAIVNGGSLLAKFRQDGPKTPPTEMFPLDWRFLQAWARIGHPIMLWATVQTGELKWLPLAETMFTGWATVSGANGAWLCTSPLQQLGVTIKIDEAAQRYAAAFFKNAARPGGAITLPESVNVRQNPEITAKLQEKADEIHGGVDQAFKVAVLGGGATWTPWGANASEAQLVETREQDLREVCAVLDMPFDAMFGVNAATPEGEAQVWKALMPYAHLGDNAFNAQVVWPEEEWLDQRFFTKTDFNEALFGDLLVLSDKMVAEVGAGLRTVNEGRVPLGLEPREEPAADELIYHGANAGLLGEMPGSVSLAEEEREMVMPPDGEAMPLDEINTELGANEGGA